MPLKESDVRDIWTQMQLDIVLGTVNRVRQPPGTGLYDVLDDEAARKIVAYARMEFFQALTTLNELDGKRANEPNHTPRVRPAPPV